MSSPEPRGDTISREAERLRAAGLQVYRQPVPGIARERRTNVNSVD